MGIDAARSSTIPIELRSRPQWMRWFYTKEGGKIPVGASDDPTTWTSFDSIANEERIAFTISGSDGLCGIDLDGCIVDGTWAKWSDPFFEKFRGVAYCEVSPSGTGVKFTTTARKPAWASRCTHVIAPEDRVGDGKQQIECYDFNRFWTVTGKVIEGFERIGDGQAAVDWLCETYLKGEPRQTGTKRLESSGGLSPLSLLKRGQAYADAVPGAPDGNRNNTAFKLAGHLHAIPGDLGERLTDGDVYHILRSWNGRNTSPLSDDELMKAAINGRTNGTPPADKPPKPKEDTSNVDEFVNRLVSGASNDLGPIGPKVEEDPPADDWEAFDYVGLRGDGDIDRGDEIIKGALRAGEVAFLVASSKDGKSWAVGQLGWCVVTGTPFLGIDVKKGKVLLIDNELKPKELAFRHNAIAKALMHQPNAGDLNIVSRRGKSSDVRLLKHKLCSMDLSGYSMIIIDCLYKCIPEGKSENDNGAMGELMNALQFISDSTNVAVVVVHHTTKGDQSTKATMDLAAGAGSFGRSLDCLIAIREHEQEGLNVAEFKVRTNKPVEPLSVKFEWPLWQAVAAPATLKQRKAPRAETQDSDDKKAKTEILGVLTQSSKPLRQQRVLNSVPFGQNKTLRVLNLMANQDKTIKRIQKRKKGCTRPIVYWQVLPAVLPAD